MGPEPVSAVHQWAATVLARYDEGFARIRDVREASGCAALFREADAVEGRASEVARRVSETVATTPSGLIAQVTFLQSRPHVRLRTGRPVSQYAGSEGCAGLAGAEPHA